MSLPNMLVIRSVIGTKKTAVYVGLVVVMATIVWTQALLVITNTQLSMVSSMLNSIVTIVGVATVTHITVRCRQYGRTLGPVASLRRTLLELLST